MDNNEGGVVVVMKRAEIDTRAPFRSVKEAVTLFGEKVLAGEVYANKLKEMREASENRHGPSKIVTVTAELEETKQSLEKAKEESTMMVNYLSSLKQELDRTKRELQQMKERESDKKQIMDFEIDQDIKIVEDSTTTKFEVKKLAPQTSSTDHHHHYDDHHRRRGHDDQEAIHELQKKRYVTFANPPSLAQVIVPKGVVETLERHPSLKKTKKKKKPLIPLIGAIFSKKKGTQQEDMTASPRI
ncbi:hypothetical protein ACOSP7_011120 [Xanthoceras sorbifolium]|uniref:WEB family protein n=1 Tax=Xanthoceras sorbifolium TaxID=99658 RepID=A0ABQ8HS05_9ROSI|nr:hypothetical protein JRO89_XS07G0022900 [Xanthoceras sorbifolium]